MSIYKRNIDPIALTESDADAFLRDMDITLYEDTMVIEGTLYEGAYGEEVLAENGIFLYDDGIVLEGKQAEEYLRRKQEEYDKNKEPKKNRFVYRDEDGVRKYHNDKVSPSENNPRFSTARSIANHRSKYNDVMPKSPTKSERKYAGAKRYDDAVHKSSEDFANRAMRGRSYSDEDFDTVYGTVSRRFRKSTKEFKRRFSESTIFSDIEII